MVGYNRKANHCYLSNHGARQLVIGTFSDGFVHAWRISRFKCDQVDYNYYSGVLAILDGSLLSVVTMETSSMSITHQLLIQIDGLLKIQFVGGTWCVMCVYRQEVLILQLGSEGTLQKKFKIPLALEDE